MQTYYLALIWFMLIVGNIILFMGLGAITEGLDEIRKRLR
jgi:hypothetical protein